VASIREGWESIVGGGRIRVNEIGRQRMGSVAGDRLEAGLKPCGYDSAGRW